MVDKDLGFVLRRFNYRETSVLAQIFLRRFGRVTGLLKGFYTRKKEFSSSMDVYSLNEFVLYPRRGEIWLVSYADIINDFGYLRSDIHKNSTASIVMKVVSKATALHDAHPEVFTLLTDSLTYLENTHQSKILYAFLVKFLSISGFKPEFNRCISCHKPHEDTVSFSAASGGLICSQCRSQRHDVHTISRQASRSLNYFEKTPFPEVLRLSLSARCEEEIVFILKKFMQYHLELEPFAAPIAV